MAMTPESKNLVSGFIMSDDKKNIPEALPKPKNIFSIGVIGAGVMGSGITQLCAEKDHKVYMKDIRDAFVSNGMKNIRNNFDLFVEENEYSSLDVQKKMSLIQSGIKYDNLKDADLIIEAAYEKLDIKTKIIEECEMVISNDAILATSTSTFSINELAKISKRPKNFIGMHFLHPVGKKSLVEIIKSNQTSDETVSTVYNFAIKLGKTPIIVKDSPGFVVNRLLCVYFCEAGRLLKEGGSIKLIDQCFVDFGMPMGPFQLLDEIGFDIVLDNISSLQSFGEQFSTIQGLDYLVEKGIKGKKSGRGFYVYNSEKKGEKKISPEAIKIFGKPTKKQFSEDILDRCLLLMIIEASNMLDEGISSSPEDIDLSILLGVGFPDYRGGLLNYCDNRTIKNVVSKLKNLTLQFGKRFQPSALLEEMAKDNLKFFPNKPNIPYVERRGPPIVRLEGVVRARL
jgi:3-hydroxyacyl-CoA dehydrogenase / enoyl-CoA hydratase / 3-hydroxybutyryl-CoA epimerase